MTPREWYISRLTHWTSVREAKERVAVWLSRFRIVTFLGGVALLWYGVQRGPVTLAYAGISSLLAFAALVVAHDRSLERVARAVAAQSLSTIGLARIDRDWKVLPLVDDTDVGDEQPVFAADLDVIGQSSLRQWIGRSATIAGTTRVRDWLLVPAGKMTITRRQAALRELAPQALWRESLLVEGQRTASPAGELDRFFAWAETRNSAVPSSIRTAVPILTFATLGLLAAQIFGWTTGSWWLSPLLAGVVISFAFAAPVYRTFDTVSMGERTLRQHAAMFALVEQEQWTAPVLNEMAERMRRNEYASRMIFRLARLAQWSELRRSAALLHFPIEALTLWDFHILFAIERWRTQCGRHVRGWFDALGEIDALATLATIRHDEPGWTLPEVDYDLTSIEARELGHPLIPAERRVGNDVTVGPPGTLLLVTGSNMSGKSTLLRALGVNVVLAQAGAPACAKGMRLPPCDLQTSLKIEDSLEHGVSYFMAALARLKAIVDAADRDRDGRRRVVYLLDEVLQGTNSAERATAVRAVARHLLESGAIGAVTTHDLTIATVEPFVSQAQLVHFSERVHADGKMTFDYILRDGLATSRNALRLMQLIGLSPQ
ncbi:MAG TPA: hypothetical protein VL484_09890 [Vicinamibacterales bacterium]|jgi:energy-coupling factor transporter ATP-binding protein EcfA2|nr:hypothetical protein [Vicinamibacterales bacterium]